MKPYKAPRRWIDRDWEQRGYISTFAFAQKAVFLSPLLLLGVADLVVGIQPGTPQYYWSFGIALGLCFVIGGFQAYRWVVGYSRPSWHEEQARKRFEGKGPSK